MERDTAHPVAREAVGTSFCSSVSVVNTGGEPLWIAPKPSRAISPGTLMATDLVKQAAPANDPARGLSLRA